MLHQAERDGFRMPINWEVEFAAASCSGWGYFTVSQISLILFLLVDVEFGTQDWEEVALKARSVRKGLSLLKLGTGL